MQTSRVVVSNDGVPVLLESKHSGNAGSSMAISNRSTQTLALCGHPDEVGESFRGCLPGSVLFFDLSQDEKVYIVNNGTGPADVDFMVTN